MSCIKKSTSKYMSRPSPPYSESECSEGDIKKGNDGDMYIVKKGRWVSASNNTNRSVKSNKRTLKKSIKRSVKKSNKRSGKKSKKRSVKKTEKRSDKRSEKTNGRPTSSRKFAVMLAKNYDPKIDPTGWWHSEKLDGVRAVWSTKDFVSRNNKIFRSPDSYKKYFPKDEVLDGELFTKRGDFKGAVSVVSHKTPNENDWKKVKYMAFDLPLEKGDFETRMKKLKSVVSRSCRGKKNCPIKVVKQTRIKNRSHLNKLHKGIVKQKGEGSMIRRSKSPYENKRSGSLLKIKDFYEDDAIIVSHEKGSGKYKNNLGKLIVKWRQGKHKGVEFKVGSGFTDAERKGDYAKRFPKGKKIRVQYTEIQSSGKPRFPVYQGVHADR